MKYFKITRTWAVKAETEEEAFKLVTADPKAYLDSESVTRTEYKNKSATGGGWGHTIREQVLGS
jgi:hypothetical protein